MRLNKSRAVSFKIKLANLIADRILDVIESKYENIVYSQKPHVDHRQKLKIRLPLTNYKTKRYAQMIAARCNTPVTKCKLHAPPIFSVRVKSYKCAFIKF